jgi:pyrrolysine biosynthesis protein PylC
MHKMKVVIVGGKLQGIEAAYLARKADWEITLIDRRNHPPACGLCDEFYQLDIVKDKSKLQNIIKKKDMIIPAFEDRYAVKHLIRLANKNEIPVAFDITANAISTSKRYSDMLFAKNNIPAPRYWPDCSLPLIAKPCSLSGSHGVSKIVTEEELKQFITKNPDYQKNWVIQEYLEGPSYSLEVIGYKGNYITLQTTEIHVDELYDCKRVVAPARLTDDLDKKFHNIASQIAGIINFTGIMDVEIINHNDSLKVLEIDARLPSQTPTAVYNSTGVNMLELLADIYVYERVPIKPSINAKKHVIYEHVKTSGTLLKTSGEHIMTEGGPLKYNKDFFGADEALTNYNGKNNSWVATLIITANSAQEVKAKRKEVLNAIMKRCGLISYIDSSIDYKS